jgi:hypothetical protein
MEAFSPPKEGPLKDIAKWALSTGLAWAQAFAEGLGYAEELTKKELAKVGAELQQYVKGYTGLTLGNVDPARQREDLRNYIRELEASLPRIFNPEERLAVFRKIVEYRERLDELAHKEATAEEKLAQRLIDRVRLLDKALLTTTDPKRVRELTREIEESMERLNDLLNTEPRATTAANTAAAAGPPNGGPPNGGLPAGWTWSNPEPGVWIPVDPTGNPQVHPQPTVPAPPLQNVGDLVSGPGGMHSTGGATQVNVNVYNPAPEPASASTVGVLRHLAAVGDI